MPSHLLASLSRLAVHDFRRAGSGVTFDAGPGPDLVLGSRHADTFRGGSGADALFGFKGADTLFGGRGSDALFGHKGADTLRGGPGLDAVSGGAGSDTFVFAPGDLVTSRARTNGHGGRVDTVLDFQGAGTSGTGNQDVIRLEGFGAGTTLAFAGLAGGVRSLQHYEVKDPTTPGADGFILVSMANGGRRQLTAADVVVVAPRDQPVTAADDAYAAVEDTALAVAAAAGVLANDQAPDGGRAVVVPAGGTITTAQGGIVTIAADGSFTYAPLADFNGTDSFTYTARDADGDTDTATVTLRVAAVQDPLASVRLADVAAGVGGFKIIGEAAFDLASYSVSNAGDVNGDSLADLLVGAPSFAGRTPGAAYVVFGKADGTAVNLDAVAAGTGGFKIVGEALSDGAGWSLSAAGDLNGDGLADLLVGAPSNGAAGRFAGAAYVVFGQAGGTAVDLDAVAAGVGGFKIVGEAAGEAESGQAGLSVSATGDVNGDGLADLLVGAPSNEAGGTDAGAAYVVFSKADGTAVDLDAVAGGTGGFKIVGEAAGDRAGLSVSAAGDLNGDGLGDLLVGAPSFAGAGAAYVVFGQAGGAAVDLDAVAAGSGGFKIVGEAAGDQAGLSVSATGDVDGDGLADLLVGAPFNDAGGFNVGAAYVVFGQAGGGTVDLAEVAAGTGGFKIVGEAVSGQAGRSVSAAGDLNGDGLADLLVGAPFNDAGAAYVVFGQAGGAAVDLDAVAAGVGGFKIVGEAAGDQAGWSVSAAGDVDGDGLADLLVGAPLNDAGGSIAGASYVIHGSEDWLI